MKLAPWKHRPQNIFPTLEQKFRICSAVGEKFTTCPSPAGDEQGPTLGGARRWSPDHPSS